MPSFPLPLLLAVLGLACVALGVARCRRAAALQAARHRQDAERHDRMLGLFGQDLQARGMALLGLASELPQGQAARLDSEARRILGLADDLAEWRANDTGGRHLRAEPVPVKTLLEETVASVAAQIAPGRRQWRIAAEFDAVSLHADRRALAGAVVQVLSRVVRLTRDGDWIGLRLVLAPDTLSIVIEDDGTGLGAEDLAPGAATEGERTRGLGFGLASARSLLEAHGGALRLEAVHGIGARAWLILPRDRVLAA